MCRFYLSQTIFYYTNNLSEFLQESSLSAAIVDNIVPKLPKNSLMGKRNDTSLATSDLEELDLIMPASEECFNQLSF